MKEYIEQRVLEEAAHIIRTKDNLRATANKFKVSKNTVHKDLTERLHYVNPQMEVAVLKIINWNKAERAKRGGEATKRKYRSV
jgi:putative DeoR family transcriptional regulator, stage III sporulation protein D